MSSIPTRPLVPAGFDLQGHRGARGLRPENTLPAFALALELGVTTLELDVVISQDHEVVVSHEPWLNAAYCSKPDGTPIGPEEEHGYNLYAMPYEAIAQYDCGRRGHPTFPTQTPTPAAKPLLRAVLAQAEAQAAALGRPVFYNIETKARPAFDGIYHPDPATFTDLLLGVLAEAGVTARTTLQSFDVRTLQVARTRSVPLRLSLLVAAEDDLGLTANLAALGFVPDLYSPDYRLVDAALLHAAHEDGMQVIPWTINDPNEMRRLRDLGVDGLITDYPDRGLFLLADQPI